VVPVARVTVLGGGGGGRGGGRMPGGDDDAAKVDSGGGGGGVIGFVEPIGYIEMTDGGSRWVAVERGQSEQLLRALKLAARFIPGGRRTFALGALALIAQVLFDRFGGSHSFAEAPLAAPPAQG